MLREYLKSRGKIIMMFLFILLLFGSSYLLFEMPLITVVYPAVLSILALLIFGAIDYYGTHKKHKQLQKEVYDNPSDLIEADYQKIIEKIKEEQELSQKRASSQYSNMIEYYTVWAHQIKTPIASMRLSLQSEDSDLARHLSSDLNRIEAYVEMVLTFLRLDSDTTDYVFETCDLDSLIRAGLRKFSRDFILKKLSLDFRPCECKILTDEKWLSFVIEQVLSNALKYTDTGKISIYMEKTNILCIEDTGIGIPPEDLPRIFENGYTGFNGREDKRASGIGLYLSRRICDNLGHKIWAESEAGLGTKIYLDLNRKELGIE